MFPSNLSESQIVVAYILSIILIIDTIVTFLNYIKTRKIEKLLEELEMAPLQSGETDVNSRPDSSG